MAARPPQAPDGRARSRSRRALLPWLAACSLAPCGMAVIAQVASAASVKAAYLYKILAYVDWPTAAVAADDAPRVIGVLADEPVLAELLQIVSGRRVQGHAVVARRVVIGDAVDDLHVLFVGRGASANLAGWLPGLKGRAVLVVTDTPAGLTENSVLNFVLVEGHVRFEASLAAAERSGLKLSARLLAVAERVVPP